jgi:hypothetical protein
MATVNKKCDTVYNVVLQYSWIKYIDVPLFILYMVISIQTSRIKHFDTNFKFPRANSLIYSLFTDVELVAQVL